MFKKNNDGLIFFSCIVREYVIVARAQNDVGEPVVKETKLSVQMEDT